MAERRRATDNRTLRQRLLTAGAIPVQIVATTAAIWVILGFVDLQPWLSRDQGAYAGQIDERLDKLTGAVESLLQAQTIMRWQRLEAMRQERGLSGEEQVEYCTLSARLNLFIEGA